jgi:hypothetical protein
MEIEHEILKMNEPRIHFAINHFFFLVPITKHTEAKLNQQLAAVAKGLSTIKRKNIISK